jgi:hypothetical protein
MSLASNVAAAATNDELYTAPMNITTYVVFAVALLLLVSVIVFIKVVFFNRRSQKLGLVFILLAVPLYLVYYDDQFRNIFGDQFKARNWAGPLVENWSATQKFDANFHSDIAPAILLGIILLFHLIVVQRLAAREHLVRIANLTATFFAGSMAATMLGGTIVSTFHLGWVGAVGIGFGFALVYLGALALLAALVEITVELSKLAAVWLKRRVFAVATVITRAANFVSSLGGRLVSRALIERIRAETAAQEGTFLREQDDQDQRLIEAYIRDIDRKRQARLKAMREKYGDDDSIAELRALVKPPSDGEPEPSAAVDTLAPVPPARDPFEDAVPPARDPFETTATPTADAAEPTTASPTTAPAAAADETRA